MIKPYYDHKGIKIFHGDCLEVMPLLGKVDACVTDRIGDPLGLWSSKKDR